MQITKAIIPAAGLGTRFLPITKAVPKEMLPLVNRPSIEFIVQEAVDSGITDLIMITNQHKDVIKDYFTDNQREQLLKKCSHGSALTPLSHIRSACTFTYVEQKKPRGLGHAVLQARTLIGNDMCGILLPDDIITDTTPTLMQLMKIAHTHTATVIAVQRVAKETIHAYGVVKIRKQLASNLYAVDTLVEKPRAEDAPSDLAIVGRYVISAPIFSSLASLEPHAQTELQLTDALSHMAQAGHPVLAYVLEGSRYDTGTPLGLLTANIALGLQDPTHGQVLHTWLKDTLNISTNS